MLAFVISCLALGVVSIIANRLAKNKTISPEIARKLVHTTLGLSIVATSYVASKFWVAVLVCVALSMVVAARELDLFENFRKVGRRSVGDIYFLVGVLASLMIAESHTPFVISVLVLTLADSAAALVGKAKGHHEYTVVGEHKSVEGSVTFLFVSMLIVLWFVVEGPRAINGEWSLVLILPLVLTALEALSPKGLDNLTLPIVATLLINTLI